MCADGLLQAPQMILIGSSGRNGGKTTLAEAVIRAWSGLLPIGALKVTSISRPGAQCPRGGAGCGACTDIGGADFVLEEERGAVSGKDTARLRSAGAESVFWLRCLAGALRRGFQAFLEKVPPSALIICESNSLRETVQPGCFIMLLEGETIKPTAERVLDRADLTVRYDKTPPALTALVSQIHITRNPRGIPSIRLEPS